MKNELIETLKEYPQWVLYDKEKRPFQVGTGRFADVSNPNTWTTYDKVESKSETTRVLMYFQSYTEISPSGTGFHIWIRGHIPVAIKRETFEIYSTLRYMTITENPTFNCPLANCQLQLNRIYEKYGMKNMDDHLLLKRKYSMP
jgi:primase-polymerase (primpol)-like protein